MVSMCTQSGVGSTHGPVYCMMLCTRAERSQEPPPVIPYQGQIYSEVEKTGLFARRRVIQQVRSLSTAQPSS